MSESSVPFHDPRLQLRHPDPEHRASERVRAAWAHVKRLGAADLGLVSETLRTMAVGLVGPCEHELATARVAFVRCVRETGKRSCDAYAAWHAELPDLEQEATPSAYSLRRSFGGPQRRWKLVVQALGAAGVEDVTAARLLAPTQTSRAQLWSEGLRAFMAMGPSDLTEQAFLSWCRQQLEADDPDFAGPLPRQHVQIRRAFRDWPGMLETSGFPAEAASARERLKRRPAADGELLELLRRFATQTTKRDAGSLKHWLDALPQGEFAGRRRPTPDVFEKRFAGLPRAFYLAGVFSIEDFALKLGGQLDLGPDVATPTLAAAMTECHPQVSERLFEEWRRRRVREAAAAGHLLLIQSLRTVARLVGDGSFPRARERARAWMLEGGNAQAGVQRDDLLEGRADA